MTLEVYGCCVLIAVVYFIVQRFVPLDHSLLLGTQKGKKGEGEKDGGESRAGAVGGTE